MPRYRVVTEGGMDGVLFPDLLVEYTSGLKFPLQVKQGDYIPVEILNPSDIQKSLIVGSLGRLIKNGDVKVEYGDIEQQKRKRKPRQPKQQISQQTVIPSVEEHKKVENPQQKSEDVQSVQLQHINLKDIKTADDFLKASYFNKMTYIQICTDKNILSELLNKSLPDEMKSLIERRLALL